MRDIVFVQGLEARIIVGVNESERRERQTVRLDLEMAWDTAAAAAEDDLTKAVNYRSVAKAVLAHLEDSRYFLVETLAERVAELIRGEFGVPWVRIRVTKPGAVRFAEAVGVQIERGRLDSP
jgi:dihydroneopterin aldolase